MFFVAWDQLLLMHRRAILRLFQVQGSGALALVGEPNDADQAKFVPASAHHFQSTQVRWSKIAGGANRPGYMV